MARSHQPFTESRVNENVVEALQIGLYCDYFRLWAYLYSLHDNVDELLITNSIIINTISACCGCLSAILVQDRMGLVLRVESLAAVPKKFVFRVNLSFLSPCPASVRRVDVDVSCRTVDVSLLRNVAFCFCLEQLPCLLFVFERVQTDACRQPAHCKSISKEGIGDTRERVEERQGPKRRSYHRALV